MLFDGTIFFLSITIMIRFFSLFAFSFLISSSFMFAIITIQQPEGTRGGCLSVKRVDGVAEVLFSYNDRVANTSAQEFLNIFINFCITSSTVRRKLLAVINVNNNNNDMLPMQHQQQQQQQPEDAAVLSNKLPATTSTELTKKNSVDSKPAASNTTSRKAAGISTPGRTAASESGVGKKVKHKRESL
jgi:hypothetical protein